MSSEKNESKRLANYESIAQESTPQSIVYCNHGNDENNCCKNNINANKSKPLVSQTISWSHCHSLNKDGDGADRTARRKLIVASILCLIFMMIEVFGGLLANSLAIATDAAHLLTDFASFMISLFSLWMASRPVSTRMSFGWHRAEVIGALTSVLMIWVVTGILCFMAVERIINENYEIDAQIMVITATIGVIVNIMLEIVLFINYYIKT